MRTFFIFCLLCISTLISFSQTSDQKKHIFKIGTSFSYNSHIYAARIFPGSESVPLIKGKQFYAYEISGYYSLNEHIGIESGLAFTQFFVQIDPWGQNNEYNEEVPFLFVPLRLRCNIFKYLYCTGGILFGFDFSDPGEMNNQSGLGITLGTGLNYEFRNRLSIFAGPYANMYSYISYNNGPFNQDLVVEASIRIGMSYRFK